MLGLTLHLSGGGAVIDIWFIYSYFQVLMCGQKTFIVVYLILTNKFLLKNLPKLD